MHHRLPTGRSLTKKKKTSRPQPEKEKTRENGPNKKARKFLKLANQKNSEGLRTQNTSQKMHSAQKKIFLGTPGVCFWLILGLFDPKLGIAIFRAFAIPKKVPLKGAVP